MDVNNLESILVQVTVSTKPLPKPMGPQFRHPISHNELTLVRYYSRSSMSFRVTSQEVWPLQWRHNECHGVSNHRRLHCLLNCWYRPRSKKTPKLRITGLCVGNSPVTGKFPAQKAITRKMFSFDDVIMGNHTISQWQWSNPEYGSMNNCIHREPYIQNKTNYIKNRLNSL